MADARKWPDKLTSSKHVAEALNWISWRTQGNSLLIVAIGKNSVAVARHPDLAVEDAISLLELEADTIARLLRDLKSKEAYGSAARPDR